MKELFKSLLLMAGMALAPLSNADAAFIKTIESRQTLQPGATIYLSSGTIVDFKATTATITNVTGTSGTFGTITVSTLTFGSFAPQYNLTTKTTHYTTLTTDTIILGNTNPITLSLYTAVGNSGRTLFIHKTDTSTTSIITVDPSGSETTTGASTTTLTTTLNTGGEQLTLFSNGSNWIIQERKTSTVLSSTVAITIGAITTPPTKGTIVTDQIQWYRDGRYAVVKFVYRQSSSGADGSGHYLLGMPGLVIDTALTGTNTSTDVNLAQLDGMVESVVKGYNGTSSLDTGTVTVYDSGQFRVAGRLGGTVAVWSSASCGLNTSGIRMTGWARFPIVGWNE